MTERRAMGRGLAALIPAAPVTDSIDLRDARPDAEDYAPGFAAAAAEPGTASAMTAPLATFREVPPGRITPNPRQPRSVFDEESMAELVHSIGQIGLLQPIIVRPVPEGSPDAAAGHRAGAPLYEIVAGERRWRACQIAGLDTVPVIVRETADDQLLTEALLENLHRADLNPLEEAAAYSQLLKDFGCTQEQLARQLGRSRPQVANTIRLLRLPPAVQRRVAAGVISAGHARALLSLGDEETMEAVATRIVAEGLSVRSVEELVALEPGSSAPVNASSRRTPRRPPVEVDEVARRLGDRYDTRVKIAMGAKKGRITIEFGSIEDLARIAAIMEGRVLAEAGEGTP